MIDPLEHIHAVDQTIAEAAFDQAARELWEQYDLNRAEVSYEELSISSLLSALNKIDRPRLERNKDLIRHYQQTGIDLFPAVIAGVDENRTVIPPVIVERSKRGSLIIDGGHRATAAYLAGVTDITAMLIRYQDAPPYAGTTYRVSDISVEEEVMQPLFTGKRIPNPLFRPGDPIARRGSELIQAYYR